MGGPALGLLGRDRWGPFPAPSAPPQWGNNVRHAEVLLMPQLCPLTGLKLVGVGLAERRWRVVWGARWLRTPATPPCACLVQHAIQQAVMDGQVEPERMPLRCHLQCPQPRLC